MSEKSKAAVGGNLGRRRSRIVLGKLKSPEKAVLDSATVPSREETTRTPGYLSHMRRASLNIVRETGGFAQTALFAVHRLGAEPQKTNEALEKAQNRRRQSELLPSKQAFNPYNWTNSPTYSPQVVLDLRTISSEDLDEHSDASDHDFHPIHYRSRLLLPPISPRSPVPRNPEPQSVENYWSETAKVLSATGLLKKPERKKWSKVR